MKTIKIKTLLKMKGKIPISCLTAYSKTTAEIADKYCDVILVGDSVATTLYGMKTTKEINLDTMMLHGKVVKKYSKKSLVVFDMPYKTYKNKFVAYKNAKKILKVTSCDAVKLEGGKKISKIIQHLTNKGIPVMGHIGLLPQSASSFRTKGRGGLEKKKIFNDAVSIYKCGAFAIVIECVVEKLAKKITKEIPIPTIGIGASRHCDGQILVIDDIIGLSNFYPKFVKRYSNLTYIINESVKNYCKDVKKRKFPSSANVYN